MLSHALRAKVQNGTIPAPTDPNFKQVSLLLHGDGTNGAQNNTFLDSSTNNFTVTRNGNTTQGTNTPFSQAAGYWSNYFQGGANYLTTPSSTAYDLSNGDFTMEAWVNYNVVGNSGLLARHDSSSTGNWGWYYLSAASKFRIIGNNGATIIQSSATFVPVVGTWYHFAVTRSGNNFYFFVNGIQLGTTQTSTITFTYTSGILTYIATMSDGLYFNGYMSNVRLVKGTALYTSAFTPSTTPLTAISGTSLLTCQSNYFKDNSSNNFAITRTGTPSVQPFSPFAPTAAYSTSVNGGSMYFDGTGDYLTSTVGSTLNLSAGDFTIEYWIYKTADKTCTHISYAAQTWRLQGDSGGTISFVNSFGPAKIVSSVTVPLNSWNHVALSRSGSTTTLYINGVSAGTCPDSTTNTNETTLWIGTNPDAISTWGYAGYISNIRIVKGSAVYTANFTPPTTPLTAITNTQLLFSGTNAGIFDNASKNDLETIGNAQVSTSVKKYGTGSMKFAGSTTDVLKLPISKNLDFNTGDFTIEMWFNASNTGMGVLYEVTNYLSIRWSQASSTRVNISYDGAFRLNSNTTLSTNTWYHLALVRQSNTLKLYIDGVAQTTTYTLSYNLPDNGTFIGNYFAGGYPFNGYIDDLRVTKGVARYTANFTPPTAAFPNQ